MVNRHICIKPVNHLGTQNRGEEEAFVPQAVSVIFNGANEYIKSNPTYTMDFDNEWSQAMWFWYPADDFGYFTNLYASGAAPNSNFNRIDFIAWPGEGVYIVLWNSVGAVFKSYLYPHLLVVPGWNFVVFTWDGTNLVLYQNGGLKVPVKDVDDAGTMTDAADRGMSLAAYNTGVSLAREFIFSIGLWNKALTGDDQFALYNYGYGSIIDWKNNHNLYVSSRNLQHWWRLGHDSTDIGKDYKKHINVMDVSVNIDENDIVALAPFPP